MEGRIFGLDLQLGFDVIFMAICVFLLFLFLSKMLFDPVRKILDNRRARIAAELEEAAQDKAQADEFKTEYQSKLENINKEADEILSEARKKALRKEEEIVSQAKQEAAKIIQHANNEAELEKNRVKDEVKQEIIQVAALMASKIVEVSIDANQQNALIDDTLKEMGDKTWLS